MKCLWGTSSSTDTGTHYGLFGRGNDFVAQSNSGTHPNTDGVGGLLHGGKTVGAWS
jgi:hypothetical protein